MLDGAAKDPEHAALAVLGAGSFFGEKSLLNTAPRIICVRARTSVEVLVIGKNVFTQISPALGPSPRYPGSNAQLLYASMGGGQPIDFLELWLNLKVRVAKFI